MSVMKSKSIKKACPERSRRVFVAMSGGVDSSVAAALLKEEGHNVTGVYMLCWDGCGNNQEKQDAMRVAAQLGIPFLVWDFRKEYKDAVFKYMVGEYKTGRTPNPDVMCNREIKFGVFLKKALEAGADYIATGHYVKAEQRDKANVALLTAKDTRKDQSYFLWTLTQEQLKYCLFPIGNYLKSEVRELAKRFGLSTAAKKDSQGLCFVGNIDFGQFLRSVMPPRVGMVRTKEGAIIGKHDGVQYYTVGQRHGLNIGGFPEPLYIAQKDVRANVLVVAKGEHDEALFRRELVAENFNWIGSTPHEFPLRCQARIRYRQPLQSCEVFEDGSPRFAGEAGRVVFDSPQRAVAPGQSIVFYSGEKMLGGAVIQSC